MAYQTGEIYVKPQLNLGNCTTVSTLHLFELLPASVFTQDLKLHCPWHWFRVNVTIHSIYGGQTKANLNWQFAQHCFKHTCLNYIATNWKHSLWFPSNSANQNSLKKKDYQIERPLQMRQIGLSLMGLTATVHRLYETKYSHNFVKDISSRALMCPQKCVWYCTVPKMSQMQ